MKRIPTLLSAGLIAVVPIAAASAGFAETRGQARHCPPGLAKKSPACVPPGQAKKGVTANEWQDRHVIGRVVDRDDLAYLDDYPRYRLPALPTGQRYAVVDDRIVVIDAESYRILQLIRAYTALVD